jgi:hypothetical protein
MTFIAGRWWHNRRAVKGSILAIAVLLSACYGLPTEPRPPNGQCFFPPGTHFAFIGVTSGAALGLSGESGAVGRWWVSSERVSQWWRPLPPNVPTPPPSRQACGIFTDGSVEMTGVPENWHLPFNVRY